jgi:D-alanyl-D-alanine carboxypeptidase
MVSHRIRRIALGCVTGLLLSCATPQSPALKAIDAAALQATVNVTAKELLVPGALVLLSIPQGNFTVTYGTTTPGATIPPHADTHFRIASNTKTMTAAVIVQLAQEGQLDLDDPVSKYVSGVPDGDQITIAELLTMRSGLYNYTDAPEISASLDRDPTKVWTPDEVLTIAFKHPSSFPPGTAFQYCNTNYALLGLIAENLDHGKPLARILQDRLFRPLGMKDTALPAATSNTLPEPYSHGYLYGSSAFALVDQPYPPDVQAAARGGTLKPNDDTGQNPSYAAAAGGVVSTANDLVTWTQALVGGRLFTSTISAGGSTAYGPRIRASPRASSTGTAPPRYVSDRTRSISTAARCPATTRSWVRPGQPGDARSVGQPASIPRREADSQYPHAESARSDRRGISAPTSAGVNDVLKMWGVGLGLALLVVSGIERIRRRQLSGHSRWSARQDQGRPTRHRDLLAIGVEHLGRADGNGATAVNDRSLCH